MIMVQRLRILTASLAAALAAVALASLAHAYMTDVEFQSCTSIPFAEGSGQSSVQQTYGRVGTYNEFGNSCYYIALQGYVETSLYYYTVGYGDPWRANYLPAIELTIYANDVVTASGTHNMCLADGTTCNGWESTLAY